MVSFTPKPPDRTTLALSLFAFGFVNFAVILHFAQAAGKPLVMGLLGVGILCGLPAWIRMRRS